MVIEFQVFPRLRVRLAWYAGDEELAPSAALLLPANIESFLGLEDIVVLSEQLVARLAKQARAVPEVRQTVKPLYIVGTQRDVGKTTFCIGLISALQQRGLRVGYTKPLGQRVSVVNGHPLHEDALLVTRVMHMDRAESASMAVPLTRGRVEHEIYDLHVPELAEKVVGRLPAPRRRQRRGRHRRDGARGDGIGAEALGRGRGQAHRRPGAAHQRRRHRPGHRRHLPVRGPSSPPAAPT